MLTVWSRTESGNSHGKGINEVGEESEGEVQVVGGVSSDHVSDGGVAEEGDSRAEVKAGRSTLVQSALDDLEPIVDIGSPTRQKLI